jgi:hypothetical protein
MCERAQVRNCATAQLRKFSKILTDNGPQFAVRFTTTDKTPSGKHAFDVCAALPAEHRLAPPRHSKSMAWSSVPTGASMSCNNRCSLTAELIYRGLTELLEAL